MINWFRKQPMPTKVMLSIGLFFIFCGLICCSNLVKGANDDYVKVKDSLETSVLPPDETPEPTDKSTKKVTKKTDELKTINAHDIITAYDKNEIAADEIYKNKQYKIKGIVDNISEMFNVLTVTLIGDVDDFYVNGVTLYLKDSDKHIVAKLTKGQSIIIQGTIEGMGWDIDVKDVKFIEYGENKNE